MKNERNDLVERSGRFSIITLRGGVLARVGGPGWKEQDEAVLEHRSKLNSDEDFSNKGIVSVREGPCPEQVKFASWHGKFRASLSPKPRNDSNLRLSLQ